MGKNGVKVIIRARPTAVFAQNQIHIDQDENTIEINLADSKVDMVPSNRKDSWKFKFHQVLQNAGQDKVYEAIARDIVHGAVVDGINGTIMAYGQTGAGKTFTMIGDTRNYQHRGIAPRAIAQVFQEIESRIEIEFTVHVSYMEIYNDGQKETSSWPMSGIRKPSDEETYIKERATAMNEGSDVFLLITEAQATELGENAVILSAMHIDSVGADS
ncbi:unnamed protein product [Aphanomyces euteiches]